MIKHLILSFFVFILFSNQANSTTCNDTLTSKDNTSATFNKNNRLLGFEIEVLGNKIEDLAKYLAQSYGSSNYTRPLKFSSLTKHPSYFKSYEAFYNGEVIKNYSIHGFSDDLGNYHYSLYEDNNIDDYIAASKDLDEIFEIVDALLSEDLPQEEVSIEENEIYTWRVMINHTPLVSEEREITLHSYDNKTNVTLFLEPEEANEALMGLTFRNKDEAFGYIEELIAKGTFIGDAEISTIMGTVRIVPETSSNDLNQTIYIGIKDFSSEVVFPPVGHAFLRELLTPLKNWASGQQTPLIVQDEDTHLATHLNVEYDPNNLLDLVEMMLKLNEEFNFFKNKYQINSARSFFAKALTQTQIDFLISLKEKGVVTKRDLEVYVKLHYTDTEDGPIIDKFFWLNILHAIDEESTNYRPALEIRIADAMLEPDKLEELADDILRVISQD